jgi:hypothetical protein
MVAAVASLLLVAPSFAQAAPVCGSTDQQWLGSFDGDFVTDVTNDVLPMSIEVTLDATGKLDVTTELDGTSSDSSGTVIGDRLRWSRVYPSDSFILWTSFHADFQGVTCSGGVVTEFTGVGVDRFYSGHEFLWGEFELAR